MIDQATLITQALGLHQQGQFERARTLYEQALAAHSTNSETLHLLGVLELQTGAPLKAIELLDRASKVDMSNPQILANLGNAYFATGRMKDALTAFQQSLEQDADSPETWAGCGNAFFELGEYEQAVEAYQRALHLSAAMAEVWRGLASSLLALEQPQQALSAIDLACSASAKSGQAPTLPVVMTRGNVLMALGRAADALLCFEQVVKDAPDFPHGYVSLGSAYQELAQPELAQRQYLRAIDLDPKGAEGHYALGLLQKDQGEFNEARATFRRVLDGDPGHGRAHRALASVTRYDVTDTHLKDMQRILADGKLADEERKHLCFALGKALEDCARYDEAFEHISLANRLHRKSIRYTVETDEKRINRIAEVFDGAFLRKLASPSVRRSPGPISVFIVGMPRSGTSLVEQILASHPDAYGAGELDYLERSAGYELNKGADTNIDHSDPLTRIAASKAETVREIGDAYRQKIQALSPGSRWIVDKMPANFLHIGLIHLALPDAVIIHCQRHPLATCWSVFKNYLGASGHSYAFEQNELGRYYRLYRQLMTHWDTVMPGVIRHVKYEELVANQETVTRQLLKDCGIDWDDECLNFHATRRPVKTLSASQVRRPIYTDALAQWEHYTRHLEPLTRALNNTDGAGIDGIPGVDES